MQTASVPIDKITPPAAWSAVAAYRNQNHPLTPSFAAAYTRCTEIPSELL